MKKRLFKFLSMLLILSIVLCNSSPVIANAEEYETLEIPNYEDIYALIEPGKIILEKGDCKNFKIIINEYSYFRFRSGEGNKYLSFSLYSDKNKKNELLNSKNYSDDDYPSIFLPKGEYYLNLTCSNNASEYMSYLYLFGKISVVDLMKGGITKKKSKLSLL